MATIIISQVDNNKENMSNTINDQLLIYNLNHLESEMRFNMMLGKLSRENFKILYANIVKIYDASFRYGFDENAQLYRSTILDVLNDCCHICFYYSGIIASSSRTCSDTIASTFSRKALGVTFLRITVK